MPSYHCGHTACSVRYTPQQGCITVVKTPEQPYFVEEPATNVLQCPRHGAWLYRCQDEKEAGIVWRCGVEDCQHTHADIPGPNGTAYSDFRYSTRSCCSRSLSPR